MDLCPAQASSLGLFFSSPEFNFSACIKWPTGFPPSIYTLADAWQALVSFYRVRKRDLSPLVCTYPWYFSFRHKKPPPAFSTHASHVGFKSRHIWCWLLISIIWVEFLSVKAGSSIQPCVLQLSKPYKIPCKSLDGLRADCRWRRHHNKGLKIESQKNLRWEICSLPKKRL